MVKLVTDGSPVQKEPLQHVLWRNPPSREPLLLVNASGFSLSTENPRPPQKACNHGAPTAKLAERQAEGLATDVNQGGLPPLVVRHALLCAPGEVAEG